MKTGMTILLLCVALAGHTVMCNPACDGNTTPLADSTEYLCDMFIDTVFRGTIDTPVDTTLPANNQREDSFTVTQVFKGSSATQLDVIYHHDASTGCNEFPYSTTMEMIIFGTMSNGKVEVIDCKFIRMYDCLDEQSSFNSHSCEEEEFPGF